jgi:predicted  nucleic acid-binding Zn ribbon protein
LYLAQVTFSLDQEFEQEIIEDIVFSLIGSLYKNGQILGEETSIAEIKNGYRAYLYLPMPNSLDLCYSNKYGKEDLEKLNENGVSFSVEILGECPESSPICECKKRDYFILFTNYISLESPLRCGNCFGIVPLYLIPHTYYEEYHDIISWQSDYKACDGLQMGCQTGNRFGMHEISKFDSSLSRRGIEICNKINSLTGTPSYYYLYRYNDKSRQFEEKRKCSSCGGEWFLNEPLHNIFDFKCDQCRLLSNISWSVR